MPLPKLRRPHTKDRCRAHVSDTISTLMHEGYPQKQAVAIALSHARKEGCRLPDTRAGRISGFDLFDDVEDVTVRRHADELSKELGPAYSHPASRLLTEKATALLSSPMLLHFVQARSWAVEVPEGVDPLEVAPKIHRSLVGKRSLTASDPFLHDMTLYVVGPTFTAIYTPKGKAVLGSAAGRRPFLSLAEERKVNNLRARNLRGVLADRSGDSRWHKVPEEKLFSFLPEADADWDITTSVEAVEAQSIEPQHLAEVGREGRAAGKRAPKGTPTDLNLSTLFKELERHHGLEAALGHGPRALGPLFAFYPTSMNAMRRLADAGYIAPALSGIKGHWELTGIGQSALARWRAEHAGRWGIPASEGQVSGEAPTEKELHALRSVYRAGSIWTITMKDDFHALVARLADKGLVVLVPRYTRRGDPNGKDAQITDAGRAALSRGRASGKVANARYGQEPSRFEATSKPALERIDRGGFLIPAGRRDRYVLEDDSCAALHRFQARHGIPEGTVCAGRSSGRRGGR